MNNIYELVGGPIDGGIIHLQTAAAQIAVLKLPNTNEYLYYQSDPADSHKLLYIGSIISDSDIVPPPSQLPSYRGPNAAN